MPRRACSAPRAGRRRPLVPPATDRPYLTSFQNAAFSRHAMTVKIDRKISTNTPMRMRSAQVGDGVVILERRHRAWRHLFPAPGVNLDLVAVLDALFEHRPAIALQLPQHVRHAHAREREVVPAGGLGVVAVVGAQVRVEIVGAAAHADGRARARDHRQVRRHAAEPLLGVARVHRDLHQIADPVGREHQVALDLLFAQSDVAQAVVAHERRRMAVQAVVDEQLGAVLQRGEVVGLLGGETVPGDAAAGGVGTGEGERGEDRQDQLLHDGFSLRRPGQCGVNTTRSGTGLNSPMRVHHGIRRKKAK